MTEIKFRDGERILTLWPERHYEDGWVVGWCPELQNTMSAHPSNIVQATVLGGSDEPPQDRLVIS